eukprot:CAMPEP_0184504528 /NCGR_PEP_ID=MMETSP0113_2-20130426/52513_1 /TAXON_ID=91329 /ORGANISM="Norrisiella sphaerica, Strain BC52" /LENGTH=533 /DNA_ID=CAMNT_0026894177 /DNA_START=80 /DNA_END=1681 /DNA_ORIENTATION=+
MPRAKRKLYSAPISTHWASKIKLGNLDTSKMPVGEWIPWEHEGVPKGWQIRLSLWSTTSSISGSNGNGGGSSGGSDATGSSSHVTPVRTERRKLAFRNRDGKEFQSLLGIQRPPKFTKISENKYLGPLSKYKDLQSQCNCDPRHGELCGSSECLNFAIKVECGKNCACEHRCMNQRLRKGTIVKHDIKYMGEKGFGFVTLEDLHEGQLIGEYRGEIIDQAEKDRRLEFDYKENQNFYLLDLGNNETIDATRKGSSTRFINHSCDPNAETQKWTVDGKQRIGIYALKYIPKGSEVTFDYKYKRVGSGDQKCYCGADNCRGTLGAGAREDVSYRQGGSKTRMDVEEKTRTPEEILADKLDPKLKYLEDSHLRLGMEALLTTPVQSSKDRLPVFLRRNIQKHFIMLNLLHIASSEPSIVKRGYTKNNIIDLGLIDKFYKHLARNIPAEGPEAEEDEEQQEEQEEQQEEQEEQEEPSSEKSKAYPKKEIETEKPVEAENNTMASTGASSDEEDVPILPARDEANSSKNERARIKRYR